MGYVNRIFVNVAPSVASPSTQQLKASIKNTNTNKENFFAHPKKTSEVFVEIGDLKFFKAVVIDDVPAQVPKFLFPVILL